MDRHDAAAVSTHAPRKLLQNIQPSAKRNVGCSHRCRRHGAHRVIRSRRRLHRLALSLSHGRLLALPTASALVTAWILPPHSPDHSMRLADTGCPRATTDHHILLPPPLTRTSPPTPPHAATAAATHSTRVRARWQLRGVRVVPSFCLLRRHRLLLDNSINAQTRISQCGLARTLRHKSHVVLHQIKTKMKTKTLSR